MNFITFPPIWEKGVQVLDTEKSMILPKSMILIMKDYQILQPLEFMKNRLFLMNLKKEEKDLALEVEEEKWK